MTPEAANGIAYRNMALHCNRPLERLRGAAPQGDYEGAEARLRNAEIRCVERCPIGIEALRVKLLADSGAE